MNGVCVCVVGGGGGGGGSSNVLYASPPPCMLQKSVFKSPQCGIKFIKQSCLILNIVKSDLKI